MFCAVAGDVEQTGGAGAHGRRSHEPPLRGVRGPRRYGPQSGGGARVGAQRPARLHRVPPRASWPATVTVPAASVANADRRLQQLMAADRDPERASSALAVSVESSAERGCSVVTVRCRDRPKLLFDVACTLNSTVDTAGDQARQEFYIRHADGSPIRTEG
jgi:hypothetical protein